MPKVDNKTVREKCNKMNDAWFEGAESATFNGITQADFQTEVEACAANDAVTAAATPLSNARITRNDELYGTDTGLCDLAGLVKKYVKSLYGADSPQYKQISGLEFRTVK